LEAHLLSEVERFILNKKLGNKMNVIYWLVGGVVAGIVIGLLVPKKSRQIVIDSSKDANLEKVKELIAKSEKVTNDQVQKLLGVSDSTAERYLDELEKIGLIKQVGETGKDVYYEKP
jgi:DNA-binding transcriptional ArsR family regulator